MGVVLKDKSCFDCKHYGEKCPIDKIGTGIPCPKWEMNDEQIQDNRSVSKSRTEPEK